MNADTNDIEARLTTWLATQIDDATNITVTGLGRVDVGHSAEMLLLTIGWREGDVHHEHDVVVRLRPPSPGLLEPYDLPKEFEILQRLAGTDVRSPTALFLESTGDVLGRAFFMMGRLPGEVFDERAMPPELASEPDRVRSMCESMQDQIAAVHNVDIDATGLAGIADGGTYLERELDHWGSEMQRCARGPLPAMERVLQGLREHQPVPTPRITLVHGDAKPGNFAFVGGEVSAVFDWEMADIGDPMADIGYAEVLMMSPTFTSHEAAPSAEEFIARWEERTGLVAHDRNWYRALQYYKLAVILLAGGWLVDQRHSDDLRLVQMTVAIPLLTAMALGELGIAEQFEDGPIDPRPERLAEIDGAEAAAENTRRALS